MKTTSTLMLLAASALYFAGVEGHGHMTSPTIRPITAKYRADCLFGLKGAGDDELQLAPLENLRARGQADQPASPTFDIMNGCRGINYEAGGPTTAVKPGENVTVKWTIQAPHLGRMEVRIVKPSKDSVGKITYKQDGAALKRIENFAAAGGDGSTTVTLPSTLSGCDTAGNCGFQFYWHSNIANQTYVTCADIVTSGGGSSGSTPSAATPASGSDSGNSTPVTTPAPAPTSSDSVGSDATPALAPTKKSCTKRMRRH